MTKEYWLKRKAGWEFFNRWEEEQRWQEYSEMPYNEKVKTLNQLLETANHRNPSYFKPPSDLAEWISRSDLQYRLDFVRKKNKLASNG